MTTYKYSVPWLEIEAAAARAVTKDTWLSLCGTLQTSIPTIDIPGTEFTDPVHFVGGLVVNHPAAQSTELFHALKYARARLTGKAKKNVAGLVARVIDEGSVLSDLPAVHAAYLELDAWASTDKSRYAERVAKWAVGVAAATMFGHTTNDKLDPTIAATKAGLLCNAFYAPLVRPMQVLEAVRLIKSARHMARTRKVTAAYGVDPSESAKLRSKARRMARAALPDRFPQTEFWGGAAMMKTAHGTALLPTGDLQRLEQYAAAAMNIVAITVFSAAIKMVDPTPDVEWLAREFTAMSTAVATHPRDDAVHVCRAYMQAYKAALAAHAGRADARNDSEAELMAMPHAETSGAVRHYASLKAMPIGRVVNLGKVHKALPAGTSLGAATLHGRYLKARQENPVRPVSAGRPVLDPDLVAKCLRDEVALALRNKDEMLAIKLKAPGNAPAWYDAWVDRKVVPRDAGWSAALDLKGSVAAPARSDYAAGTFKDSALAPDYPPDSGASAGDKTHTNMALRRFVSLDYPTQAVAVAALKSKIPRTTKSDQKSENFKDPLRLFYEATLIDRMGVSWTEACVYSVAKHHPCYMLGKSPAEQQRKARSMAEPADGGKVKRFFSFDVSNWSAGMASKVQRASGLLWAEVFDSEEVGSAYNVMANSTVYIQKHGMLAGYVSPTANFEGFDGKAMTMLHLALMSATVRRTRQTTGCADLVAELVTYIDDGAAALELPTARAETLFAEFMACAEEVYGAERFVLHPLKCMPSDRMFVFLNEVYYGGAHEVSATKAALRIASEPKEEHESLADRVTTLSSGTQGAVQAGLPNVTAGLFCYFLVALELMTWAENPQKLIAASPVAVALMVASPTAYYGLGVPSMRGFDKTGKGASLSEGIAAMQSFALAYPALKPAVIRRLRTPLPTRSSEAILRNPTGTSGLSELRTNRVSAALAAAAPRIAVNPTATAVMRPLATFDAASYARALFGDMKTVSATAIQMAWKACPLANAEAWLAKFKSSKTIADVIGKAEMRAIIRAHRHDAKNAIAVALAYA